MKKLFVVLFVLTVYTVHGYTRADVRYIVQSIIEYPHDTNGDGKIDAVDTTLDFMMWCTDEILEDITIYQAIVSGKVYIAIVFNSIKVYISFPDDPPGKVTKQNVTAAMFRMFYRLERW
jgi:hypothetical protein